MSGFSTGSCAIQSTRCYCRRCRANSVSRPGRRLCFYIRSWIKLRVDLDVRVNPKRKGFQLMLMVPSGRLVANRPSRLFPFNPRAPPPRRPWTKSNAFRRKKRDSSLLRREVVAINFTLIVSRFNFDRLLTFLLSDPLHPQTRNTRDEIVRWKAKRAIVAKTKTTPDLYGRPIRPSIPRWQIEIGV